MNGPYHYYQYLPKNNEYKATVLILRGLKVYSNLLKDQMEINVPLNRRKYPCSHKDVLQFGNIWLHCMLK